VQAEAGGRRNRYHLRKQIVEPVFGHIREAGDLRCDYASDGRPVSRICSAHGLTRSSI